MMELCDAGRLLFGNVFWKGCSVKQYKVTVLVTGDSVESVTIKEVEEVEEGEVFE